MALEDILQQIPGAPGATKTGAPSFGAANSLPVQAGADFGLSSFLPTQAGTGMFDTDTDTDNKDTGIPTVLGDKVDMDTALKAYGISGSTLEKADKDAMDAKMAELAELRKIQERNVKDRQRFIDQMQELRGQRPKAPQMQDIPGAPQSKFRNPFEAFSSPAVLLGMLGSLFTRQPLTVAFNAAAAAMKGFHEGDKETIDLETKNWKNAVDVALKQNQKELDTYKLAWDQHKENFQDLLAEFEAHAAGYKDEQMLTLLKYAGPKEIWEMLQHRIEAQSKIQQSVLGVEKTKAEITKLHAQADQARTGGFSDEDLDAIVERRLAGDVSVEAGLKRGYQGAQTWARYQAKLAEAMRDQGITPQQLLHTTQRAHAEGLGIGAEARTTGTMTARVENAVNELQTTIPLALNSSRNLPRGTFVPFNRLYQTWLAGTSDPAYNDFITRNLAVVNAYARAMNPQGIPRIAEREENKAIGILSTATSQQAYEVQLRALWAEAQASKKATQETAKSVTEGVSSGGDFPGDTKKKSTGGASGMTDEELMAIVRGGAPATPAAPSAPVTPAQQAPMYVPSVGP